MFEKNYVTLFGEITFKRRYYFDKNTNEYFFFTDLFLGLPKRKHFDPFVCSEFVENSSITSYSKAGKIVADKIGRRTSTDINISRATVRNIVLGFNPTINERTELKRLEKLLQIRLLKINGYNLKELYFKQLNQKQKNAILQDKIKLSSLKYHTNESVYDKEYKVDKEIYYPYEFNVIKYI